MTVPRQCHEVNDRCGPMGELLLIMSLGRQIKNMTEQDLAKYWSQYVKELAVLLVAMEGNDQPPREVVDRIQALVQRELLFLYIRYEAFPKKLNIFLPVRSYSQQGMTMPFKLRCRILPLVLMS